MNEPMRPQRHRRWLWMLAAGLAGLVAVVAVCEAAGWPFLVGPLQSRLSHALNRRVVFFTADNATPVTPTSVRGTGARASAASAPASSVAIAEAAQGHGVRLHLLGGLRLHADGIEIAAPAWSDAPYLVRARDARIALAYSDLFRAYRGAPLRISRLEADSLDANLQRDAEGRSSWVFHDQQPKEPPAALPQFGSLVVRDGNVHYGNVPLRVDVDAHFWLSEGGNARTADDPNGRQHAASGARTDVAGRTDKPAAAAPSAPTRQQAAGDTQQAAVAAGLQLSAQGHYRDLPLHVEAYTSGVLPWLADAGDAAAAVPVQLDGSIGRAKLEFRGTASDPLHLNGLAGRFSLEGPALAAVGDPLGVTLPTTGPFRTRGALARKGAVWNVVFDDATIGASRLNGAFTFTTGGKKPLLAGRLGGSKLLLADLGPAIGTTAGIAKVGKDVKAVVAPRSTRRNRTQRAAAPASDAAASGPAARRILPEREFDLPSLRAMEANVVIDIREFDLGSRYLGTLAPARGHLVLEDGVLLLSDLDMRTGKGRLSGQVRLDGREKLAHWGADLQWKDVQLEQWIHQSRANGAPPYISGALHGQAKLTGAGRSTAGILGSLKGEVRTQLRGGTVSHLAVEAAGLDLAQALGVMVAGDKPLQVQCAVADLTAQAGVLTPRVMVVDTPDSAIWFEGKMSLATERLDLRAIVTPKDFSPLALRTPLHVGGTLADPEVSVDKAPLAGRVGASVLLFLANPLAALIPWIDPGQPELASKEAADCRALLQRGGKVPRLKGKPAG